MDDLRNHVTTYPRHFPPVVTKQRLNFPFRKTVVNLYYNRYSTPSTSSLTLWKEEKDQYLSKIIFIIKKKDLVGGFTMTGHQT